MPSMMERMSEKSRLIRPGVVMMSAMPSTAWRRMSSADAKGLHEVRAFRDDFEQLVVRDGDDGIDAGGEFGQSFFGLLLPPRSFEAEGLGDNRDGKRVEFFREGSDHRSSTGARAAADAGGDEDHVRAFENLDDAFGVFQCGQSPDGRVRSGARARS